MNKVKNIFIYLSVVMALGITGCDSGSTSNADERSVSSTDIGSVSSEDEESVSSIEKRSVLNTEVNLSSSALLPGIVPELKSAGWLGQIKVRATDQEDIIYTHNTAGVFGELLQSIDTKDKHDLAGIGAAVLQVVFPQTTWGEDNGDYFSDYRAYIEGSSQKQVWTFQVKNEHTVDLKDASLKITLDGIYDLNYKKVNGKIVYDQSKDSNNEITSLLTLIDVDQGTSYIVSELPTANLSMEGMHVRTFRLVKGTVEANDYTQLVKSQSAASKTSIPLFEKEAAPLSGFGRPPTL